MQIQYNAPLILNFSIACTAIAIFNYITADIFLTLFTLPGQFHFLNPLHYLNLFSYIFGHAGFGHLMANLTFLLLLGPALEEKYGKKKLSQIIIITAIVTAVAHIIFFDNGLLGASGIVFLFIILSSFTNVKEGSIPLTFILIAFLFIGKEIIQAFESDNVSQFAHIAGGIIGALFGLRIWKVS